ncbi:lipase secretion chaperone [Janthinobacterium psychrotolerans]|uniref:Lipase helper protein n=1 Tax=Janthinobacterium psychrotolerans TaxID=1747903 RepID=A0A1A7C0G8_9BURK|nr:lipase secretion chaperone [Janthinobacterium psychrotolerans]OBV38225.1 Lipase chaperone LimK [Janthinobacterium psychrotolerans]
MRTNKSLIAAGALAAMALYWSLAPGEPPAPAPPKEDPDLFAFVRSMEGTRPDGNLTASAGGTLVVDAELGHLFDYYLAGLGEKPLAAIRSQIELELDRRLAPAPAREAKRLLGAYLAYKQALAGIEQGLAPSGNAPLARLQAMRALRPAYFTAQESAGLFGASDVRDDDAVARMAVLGDKQLSEAGRQQRLAALDAALTPAQRLERDAPQQVSRLDDAVRTLRAQGGGDNEVYRLRAATFTPEAAARLAELDREESQWQQRIIAWRAQKAALGAGTQDAAQVARLNDALFSPDEQRRLGAYE